MDERRVITIEPATRLEGEGKINIVLDEEGEVKDAYFQVMDYRAFESLLVGRQAEEVPRIANRVCGVCSWAHHMAAVKALDQLFGREPPQSARKLRELSYCAHVIHSHLIHFFLFASPDFFLSPDEEPSVRNFLGLLKKQPDLTKRALKWHSEAEEIQEMIAGKAVHPPFAIPGGVSKPLDQEERQEIGEKAKGILGFSEDALSFFLDGVVKNEKYADLFLGDLYRLETYYMGLVDESNRINLYDGDLRVLDPKGREEAKFDPSDYLDHIAERVEAWTYTKFPYLRGVGWAGLRDGSESGVFRVNSLPRLNVSEGMPTPRAHEAYEEFVDALGQPAHATLGAHWARLIEVIYLTERMLELLEDPDIANEDVMNYKGEYRGEGVGVVEAPRGTLIHHYEADEDGLITDCNLIVPTTMNNAAICMEIKNSAGRLIRAGHVPQGVLNRVEMALRAYDPCLSCSSHSLPGEMPLEVTITAEDGDVLRRLRRG